MTQVLRGNIIQAPRLGELDIREHGYLVLEDGVVQGIYEALPQALASAPITDYGGSSCSPLWICTSTPPSTPCWAWAWTCPCWTG